MFQQLTNFGYVRSKKEAFGFYLAYFFLIMLIAAFYGGVVGFYTESSFEDGIKVGSMVAILVVGILYFLVMKSKRLLSFSYLVLLVLTLILTLIGGALLGMIPVAYLTTKALRPITA